MRCLACATDCPDDATYCGGCGLPLRPEAAMGDERVFAPGDVIIGGYVVERQLGEGGMGAVYLASDRTSGQRVAVKVLPAALARERDIRERFVREARALAALDHPGIVPLITFAQDGDDRFLVMKYVAGEALDVVIAREGVLSPERARQVLRAMAEALAHAHAHGVIHRDVKPANVLIDDASRVVLVDFGIARTLDGGRRVTETGMLMGTPQYMSPEQIAGHPVDGRADLYACGLVLFEMLTGAPPFDDGATFDILRAHVESPVPDVDARRRARAPGSAPVPDELRAILDALLAKEPARRPDTAAALVSLLEGRGPDRLTPPTAARLPRPTPVASDDDDDDDDDEALASLRRRRWPVMVAATVVVLAVAAVLSIQGPIVSATTSTASSDAGVVDDSRFEEAVLLARARVALDKGRVDDAKAAVDAALHLGLDSEALRLARVELALATGRRDDAVAGLAALQEDALDDESRQRLLALRRRLGTTSGQAASPAASPPSRAPRPTGAPSPPPTTKKRATTPPDGEADVAAGPRPNELDDDALAAVTTATRGDIGACYAEHILAGRVDADDEDAPGGTVEVALVIKPAGAVASARVSRSSFRHRGLERCVLDAVKAWRFPPFRGGDDVLVHTFTLRPRR